MVLDYYLQLLVGIPSSHARARLTLLCFYDVFPRALTEKILERPRLMDRITAATRIFTASMTSRPRCSTSAGGGSESNTWCSS
jgi:hypothetical protein